MNWFFRYQLPATVFSNFANAFGTPGHRKQASKLWFYLSKARAVVDGFYNFTNNEWFFETASHESLLARLTPDERRKYSFDTASLDWPTCVAARGARLVNVNRRRVVASPLTPPNTDCTHWAQVLPRLLLRLGAVHSARRHGGGGGTDRAGRVHGPVPHHRCVLVPCCGVARHTYSAPSAPRLIGIATDVGHGAVVQGACWSGTATTTASHSQG